MITYKTLSVTTASICITLSIFLLFIPEPLFFIFGVAGNDSAYFLSRRASMLFVGYSAISFLSRNDPPSASRQSILAGIGISMLGLFILGLFEFLRGFAGPGILLAMMVELFLALCYLSIWRRYKKGEA